MVLKVSHRLSYWPSSSIIVGMDTRKPQLPAFLLFARSDNPPIDSMLGFYHSRVANNLKAKGQTDESYSHYQKSAIEYQKAAECFPEDDENNAWFVTSSHLHFPPLTSLAM